MRLKAIPFWEQYIEKLVVVELTNEYPDMSKTLGLLREIINRRSGLE